MLNFNKLYDTGNLLLPPHKVGSIIDTFGVCLLRKIPSNQAKAFRTIER